MLTNLTIQDFGLIHQAQLNGAAGLTVVTGETGAGKSMLMDALGMVLGSRAEKSAIRQGANQALVQASFTVSEQSMLATWLQEQGLQPEDGEIFLRRVVAENKSQAFVNGVRVTQSQLAGLGDVLADIHGQRDSAALLDAKQHAHLLDAFGRHLPAAEAVRAAYRTWQGIRKKLTEAEARNADQAREEGLLQSFLAEVSALNYQAGEEDRLSAERSRLMQTESAQEALLQVQACLEGDDMQLTAPLQQAERALNAAAHGQENALADLAQRLTDVVIELDDITQDVQRLASQAEPDPLALEEVDNRLQTVRDIARKHRVQPEELPLLVEKFAAQLDELSLLQESLDDLTVKEQQAWQLFTQACAALSHARQQAAPLLEQAVHAALQHLHMPHTQLRVEMAPQEEATWQASGAERISFSLQINPGSPFLPLEKVASGGEVSRLMLALKQVFCADMPPMTLVFDEIDTGLGGAVADAVGEVLHTLAQHHQVFAITHQPQVAAKGDAHLKIEKLTDGKTTRTLLAMLAPEQRLEEVARMLSGKEVTAEARAAAGKMLGQASPETSRAA